MKKFLTMKKIYGITMLSKRDAPSLHLDFFHTRNEHTARFLFYNKKYKSLY